MMLHRGQYTVARCLSICQAPVLCQKG